MKQVNSDNERVFDIRELYHAVLKKIGIILAIGICCAAAMFCISSYAMEKKYESTTQIYILNKPGESTEITFSNLQTSSYLIKDYVFLIKSRMVTEQVIKELGLDMKHEELVKLIDVKNPSETRVLNITVKYKDPLVAKQIADALREATSDFITAVSGEEQVSEIEEANLPVEPSSPSVIRNTILGGALGLLVSAFITILLYISKEKIMMSEELKKK